MSLSGKGPWYPTYEELRYKTNERCDDKVARLERIILEQQEQLKKLETKLDRMMAEFKERGEVNARLNKENVKLQKKLEEKERDAVLKEMFGD
jgi:hypothetical protein